MSEPIFTGADIHTQKTAVIKNNPSVAESRAVKDGAITLSKIQLALISGGFVIVLPVLLMLVGGVLWWRRRNQSGAWLMLSKNLSLARMALT